MRASAGPDIERGSAPLISRPYIEMTLELMRRFGVDGGAARLMVPRAARRNIRRPGALQVEGDASAASYFLAPEPRPAARCVFLGVGRDSVAGRRTLCRCARAIGARVTLGDGFIEVAAPASGRLHGIDADFNHIPDAAMTLAVVALFADQPTTLRNIGSWRVKETDRIAAMANELRRLGAQVDEGADWLRIHPSARLREATVETYDDHRMAMCLSLAAAGGVPVHVRDPKCVSKTFPTYFDELSRLVSADDERAT